MDSFILRLLVASNFVAFAELVGPLFNATINTTASTTRQDKDDGDGLPEETIAVIIGVGLTAMIVGCLGFFLVRGHLEQNRYLHHRQLFKLEQIETSGRFRSEEKSGTFAEEKL